MRGKEGGRERERGTRPAEGMTVTESPSRMAAAASAAASARTSCSSLYQCVSPPRARTRNGSREPSSVTIVPMSVPDRHPSDIPGASLTLSPGAGRRTTPPPDSDSKASGFQAHVRPSSWRTVTARDRPTPWTVPVVPQYAAILGFQPPNPSANALARSASAITRTRSPRASALPAARAPSSVAATTSAAVYQYVPP